jgi:two-component system OmpR family sensor kinase
LANASHELRSPLARIRMAVELVQDGAPEPIRIELARNIAELDQLIGELLLASRLDAAAGQPGPAVLVELADLVVEECARIGASCTVEPVRTFGDPALLRRMVRNLLENGQRHGGGTSVELTLTKGEGPEIRLEVADGGPGVPENEREAIFAPFYRLGGASEADGGAGLGLSLVRQIARHHGGDAECIERRGGGCVFRVTLPGGGQVERE